MVFIANQLSPLLGPMENGDGTFEKKRKKKNPFYLCSPREQKEKQRSGLPVHEGRRRRKRMRRRGRRREAGGRSWRDWLAGCQKPLSERLKEKRHGDNNEIDALA